MLLLILANLHSDYKKLLHMATLEKNVIMVNKCDLVIKLPFEIEKNNFGTVLSLVTSQQ